MQYVYLGDVAPNLQHGKVYDGVQDKLNRHYIHVIDDRGVSVLERIDRFLSYDEAMKKQPPIDCPVVRSSTKRVQTLPTDSAERKTYPILSGCLKYFPAAVAGVAHISKQGNDKHNPGQPLHHARGKSTDHGDCIIRHLLDVEDLLSAHIKSNPNVTKEMILLEVSQMAWRALAYSQALHEKFGYPIAPGAKNETEV